jgi:predicted TIM-barrel fold metal-dependent hydrolase
MAIPVDEMLRQNVRAKKEQTGALLPDPEPRPVWATVISVDDHVVEPPDMFAGRFPDRLAAAVPRVVELDDGAQAWLWNGQVLPNIGLNAVVGRPRSEVSVEPTRFEYMRRGAWDPLARLRDMDLGGIWASLCFPSFLAGFSGQRLTLWPQDDELALTAMRAYNDWHLESWCGADRSRLIPNQLPYLRDAAVAASEIRANAERGFRAVSFSEAPHRLGLPSIHSGYWDPFFEACAQTGTVVCLHVGSSGEAMTTAPDAPPAVSGMMFGFGALLYGIDWLHSGVAVRFPDLKIAMSEGGISWVAGVIDRIRHTEARREVLPPAFQRASAELLRRNFWFCALDDPSGFHTYETIGAENILVESDYPHSDSTWPDTQELLRVQLGALSVEDQRKVCWQNAAALFRHEPPVGALP